MLHLKTPVILGAKMTNTIAKFRSLITALLMLCCASVVLSACATLPVAGPVMPGTSVSGAGTAPDFSFRPSPPQADANAQQIVEGFLRAATGPTDNWSVARQYLLPGTTWNPNAGVVVDNQSERSYQLSGGGEDEDDAKITLTVRPHAGVDADGSYTVSSAGEMPLNFELARNEAGQWRISSAPPGIVLSDLDFPNVFRRYEVMFFDPSWQFLVPDSRWFVSSSAPTRIAMVLAGSGAADWLNRGVVSAIPQDVTLAAPAVTVNAGVATVELSEQALALSSEMLARVRTQFEASLLGARISTVILSVGGVPLQAQQASVLSTKVPNSALVQVDGTLLRQGSNAASALPVLTRSLDSLTVRAMQLSYAGNELAVLDTNSAVWRVDALDAVALDIREDLIEPSIDPYGYIWSVPKRAPQAIDVFAASGEVSRVAKAWPEAIQIGQMQLSRDGTRVAAVVEVNARHELWAAAVIRDTSGAPVELGEPVLMSEISELPLDLTWLSDAGVGVLLSSSERSSVLVQVIGSPARTISAPAAAVAIAGENSADVLFLLDSSGVLYGLRGTHWQRTASEVQVLGTQQGP